jgi:hypothetical protein
MSNNTKQPTIQPVTNPTTKTTQLEEVTPEELKKVEKRNIIIRC